MINTDKIYKILEKEFEKFKAPIVDLIEIQTKDPFKVLVGTILSARTKDQTTSLVVNKLFSEIDNYEELGKLSVKEIEKLIYPAGFYHNKAKYLKQLPQVLEEEFGGNVPCGIDDLLK
ncbi:MAG: endonuclease III, partial [Candidatus Cloacimonadota bacterium]|nr:endonuclease III [Candidatus Cloacimonadota bacterium]